MCGIVGYAGTPVEPSLLIEMRDALRHRGPDSSGSWHADDGTVGLAHRRLSIIDLSPGGHQPMRDPSGRVHIAFNGEIYNFVDLREELQSRGHAFRSSSDTEVILAAYAEWGEDFVRRLNGQFAFALHDDARRVLYLMRDRAGEKPLFWHQGGGRVAFASELKALFPLPGFPRRLDLAALDHYLAYAYVPRDLCLVEGVRKVQPGTYVRVDLRTGAAATTRYWDLPEADGAAAHADGEDLSRELERLLETAVRRQLLAADVPVGVLLSGGIDSSLVTALAARVSSRPVKTFTVSFPGHGAFDESPYARIVANHFGTDHTELVAEAETVSLLPALASQYDEPIGDSSMVPTFIVSRLIREHCTVALGGDGGDELFAGYGHYQWAQRLDMVRSLVPRPLRRPLAAAARALPAGTRGRNYLTALGDDARSGLANMNLYFDRLWRQRLVAAAPATRAPEELRVSLGYGGSTALQTLQRMDFRSYMVDDILVKVDRASMLASLETRAPFLDPDVIEFAFGRVPDSLKATRTELKILPKRLAARILPGELELNRKRGFSIPLHRWLEGEWGTFLREVLAGADPALFRREAIDALLQGQKAGLRNEHRLFTLMMFELWRREYRITLP